MKHGSFIWCDLSAHRADQSRDFYRDMLGWKFEDQGGYHIAHNGKAPIAGHYQMPGKFIDMRMPAFWMSYIAVDDVAETVELANSMGAKVELGPAEFDGGGQYALIRDQLGAGFTVYQGDALDGATNEYGARADHGLFDQIPTRFKNFMKPCLGGHLAKCRMAFSRCHTMAKYFSIAIRFPIRPNAGKRNIGRFSSRSANCPR